MTSCSTATSQSGPNESSPVSLPKDIEALLRDEAYMAVGQTLVTQALHAAAVKIDDIHDSRPPFGILSSKKRRTDYEQALRAAMEERTALKGRLSKIESLEAWVRLLIRPRLREYVRRASPSFARGKEILGALEQFSGHIRGSLGHVQATARELRTLSRLLSEPTTRAALVRAHADLREAATNLDCMFLQLEIADQRLRRAAAGSIFSEVAAPTVCLSAQAPIVERILNSPQGDARLLAEKAETALRTFIAKGSADLLAQADAARTYVTAIEDEYIDNYWNQLRVFAQAHYVVEADLDEVLMDLIHRRLNERQNEIHARDPFLHAR
ncbi:hypothetical protein GALL_113970 [mine drainage metagenome]|uniref:Uncharacterized protein n=1 Tax=mine drainage metagenome TaxID=410659 RepID=A0A1J5SR28_9ZZZZ